MVRRIFSFVCAIGLVAPIIWGAPEGIAQQATPKPPDAFSVAVGDRLLQVACRGSGNPTVIQEIGGPDPTGGVVYIEESGEIVSGWLGTRFCGYDRAGTGTSPADPAGVRTLDMAGGDLLALLAAPETGCPCVVLAESLGGGIALAALAQDSANFAGLVSLDSLTPGMAEAVLELAPPGSAEADLAGFFDGENEEAIDYHMTADMVPSTAPDIPIRVLAHGVGDPPPCPCSEDFPSEEYETIWQKGQTDLAGSLGVAVIVTETGHVIAGENPQLVVDMLLEVIAESTS